jgi:hypothetical protein
VASHQANRREAYLIEGVLIGIWLRQVPEIRNEEPWECIALQTCGQGVLNAGWLISYNWVRVTFENVENANYTNAALELPISDEARLGTSTRIKDMVW